LAFSCIESNIFAEQRKNASHAKKMLSARLDSIEMEKQIRKRKGESLEDLEIESKKIHDSIVVLRTELSRYTDPVSLSEKDSDTKLFSSFSLKPLINPVSLFDWIIIIVGIIALLSGIILAIGLVHTLFFRKNKKSQSSAHILPKRLDSRPESDRPVELPSSVSGKTTDKETRGIDSIRQRMQSTSERVQHADERVSPFSKLDQGDEQTEKEESKNPIRDNVIQAAKEGLNI
jgi:hypothetical protein